MTRRFAIAGHRHDGSRWSITGPTDADKTSLEDLSAATILTKVGNQNGVRASIRTIIVVVFILGATMWAAVGISLVNSREQAFSDAGSKARNLMIAFREEIAFILRGLEGEMNLIAEKMRREGPGFDLHAWGQQEVLVAPGMAHATIIGPNGHLRSTTIEPHPQSTDLRDRDHYRIHLDGNFRGLYIGQSVVGRISGVPILPISRRVDGDDGGFLGVLTILISPRAMTKLHESIDLGPHGVMTLFGLDNVIRARFGADSPDGTKGIGKSIAGGVRSDVIEEGPRGWFVRTSVIDGIPRVFSNGRVGGYPMFVTVGLSLETELAAWRAYAEGIVMMALGATLLLAGMAFYLIRRTFGDAARARAAARAITHTAEHDFLTGLPNRMLLNDRIGQAIAASRRRGDKLAVLFMDLDKFKQINDTLGHPVGDRLLQSVAKSLVACVRGADTVSRLGGDEFVALLSELQSPEDAAVIARKILHAVAQPHLIGEHELCISASIGVSIYPDDGPDAEAIVKNADIAMYQAKEAGRNCLQLFNRAPDVRPVERAPAMT